MGHFWKSVDPTVEAKILSWRTGEAIELLTEETLQFSLIFSGLLYIVAVRKRFEILEPGDKILAYILSCASEVGSPTNPTWDPGSDKTRGQGSYTNF